MNCPKCDGDTKVIDSRNVRRRRECLVCEHRFTTVEILASEFKKTKKLQEQPEKIKKLQEQPEKIKNIAPKNKNPVSKVALKSNADARRRIEDLREQRRMRDDFDYLDPDFDYLPEKW